MLELAPCETKKSALPWFGTGRFPLYLAPMAGFTDSPFRRQCKEQGADVLVTEFANAEGLVRGTEAVWQDLRFTAAERPLGVQIFGGVPEIMAEAARMVVARLHPDFIDINFGCPADKVTCRNAGSSLLRDLPLLEKIGAAVVDAVDIPVTAKIRIGWDERSIVAPEAARRLEGSGVQALAVHGRTKEQGYRGGADWKVIVEVAEAVAIPVLGNGSVDTPEMAAQLRRDTALAGLMIGRAALGYPWIFRELKAGLEGRPPAPPPTLAERWASMLRYADDRIAFEGRDPATANLGGLRAIFKSMVTDMPEAAMLRGTLEKVKNRVELGEQAAAYLAKWENPVKLPEPPLAP
ncbi:MAG TPA: tRNA-dihydrouridine synthase family protein [Opitutales bacterium]|jgi:tRNA-dihydrouridine synthase B|nr:tRNA-dihydrouridine synthase family protein [Opitutales bacterium]